MKRITSALMAVILLFSLCACGGGGESSKQDIVVSNTEKPSETPKDASEKNDEGTKDAPITVDEGLLSVEITLPATFFENESADSIKAAAKEKGFSDCTVHEDGSVTYKMSKAKHKEFVEETKASLEESMTELLKGDDAVASFAKIEHNDDFSEFNVYVKPDVYTVWDNMYFLVFYLSGAYYQAFAGEDSAEIDVVVNYINNTTGDVLETGSFREWQDNAAEESPSDKPQEVDSGKATKVPTIEETVVLEHGGVKITAKEYTSDSIWGDGIKLLIENNGEKNVGVGCEAVIVNDYMISNFFVVSVAAGKKANEILYISASELEAAGITNIGKVEVQLYLYDESTYRTIHKAEVAEIRTSDYENMDTSAENVGTELFNDKGVRIVGKYVDKDSFWGTAIVLHVENNTDKNITVSCENLSVNGFMIDSFFYSSIFAGKKAIDEITLSSDALERNDIKTIEDVELVFTAHNSDTYIDLFESEIIKFSAK